MPIAHVNGIDLYWEEMGVGKPLLLLNGMVGTTIGWTPLLPALAARFHVVAFDPRGAGRSSAPPEPYTTHQLAEDAVTLLDALGIDLAHLGGLSLGSLVGQELAIAHPNRIGRMALIGATARVSAPIRVWVGAWVAAIASGFDPAGLALWLMPWFLTPAFMARHDLVEAALGQMLADPNPPSAHGLAGQAAAALGHDARGRLGRIAAPTLVLVGPDDIVTPVADAEMLAAAIPGARLQVLERGGHVPHLEEPDAVAAALLAFLKRERATARRYNDRRGLVRRNRFASRTVADQVRRGRMVAAASSSGILRANNAPITARAAATKKAA